MRTFKNGNNSNIMSGAYASCTLDEGIITKKYRFKLRPFRLSREKINNLFDTEIKCLERLKGERFFPQLIDYNKTEDELSLRMTYVGRSVDKDPYRDTFFDFEQYKENIQAIADTLIKHKIMYSDIQRWNTCFDGEHLYLIDFNHGCKLDEGALDRDKFISTFRNRICESVYHKVLGKYVTKKIT